MSDTDAEIRISKLDAARRQLKTAITLWFTEGDPVAVHALAFAAYEIYHYVSKDRDPYRRDLLLDTDYIKDEFRKDWCSVIKKNVNFFKHADRDPNDITELDPGMNEWFVLYAILGRQLCGESQTQEESDFMWWFHLHRSKYLTDTGRDFITDHLPVNVIEISRKLSKREFYELRHQARIVSDRSRYSIRQTFPLETN